MATSDFWTKGTSRDNVLGGPARILASQRSLTTYPETIGDVLDLSTYDPQTNWLDMGHTSEPFEISDGFDTTEWVSQQLGIINVQLGNWNRNISFTLMETDNDNVMDMAHSADGRTTNADGDEVIYMWDQSDITEWLIAALHLKEEGTSGQNIIMDVFQGASGVGQMLQRLGTGATRRRPAWRWCPSRTKMFPTTPTGTELCSSKNLRTGGNNG